MTTNSILNLLDPKNQNQPTLSAEADFKKANVIVIPVTDENEKKLEKTFSFLKKEKITGKNGERKCLIRNNKQHIFVGVGPEEKMNYRKMRRFFGTAYLGASGCKPESIGLYCPLEWVEAAAVGITVSALNPGMFKPKYKKEKQPPVIIAHPEFKAKKTQASKAIKAGQIIGEGKNIMRILGSLPPNILTTKAYAEVMLGLAKKWKLKCERVSQKKLQNYKLLKAVSEGSKYDSELIVFTLHPKKGKTKKATALVGKGLCYDSGGLQSKQNQMKFMKEDMAGSASVIGTIYSIVKGSLKLRETTYFVMPLAENMMGAAAMRADDVYTTGDGQTVEIIHTDAEGRLALADAICYTKNNFKNVHRFYTIATLTGSCIIALGEHYTGAVCNNTSLASEVMETAKNVGDHAHAGPWDMDYDDNNSPTASMANLGEADREAGWMKAGMFLYRFVPKAKKEKDQAEFCHFDIAATIDMSEKGKSWRRKGFSSGVCVGLLSKMLTK